MFDSEVRVFRNPQHQAGDGDEIHIFIQQCWHQRGQSEIWGLQGMAEAKLLRDKLNRFIEERESKEL